MSTPPNIPDPPNPPKKRAPRKRRKPVKLDAQALGPPEPPPPPPPPPIQSLEPRFDGSTPLVGPTASELHEYRRLIEEKARRSCEALRLYVPLERQREFHECNARTRLIRGSNRAGKTLATCVELARAVTGRDPHNKYPLTDGRAYVVGRDEKHLGEVIYRKLFRAGAFRIIRDLETKQWRAYRPWEVADAMRKAESKLAPPLIPPRYIKAQTWKSKGDNVPEKVTLTNGWEIDFFSSLGKPPRGSDLDVVFFDEEIVDSDWLPEMSARLLDRQGRIIWGATPQAATERLLELHYRCEAEFDEWVRSGFSPESEPGAREFFVHINDNPHIDEAAKKALAADLTDAEADVRIGGNFAIEAAKIFPEFSEKIHCVDYFDIPLEWTRYAVVDPGRQIGAVLFAAVPPPDAQIPWVNSTWSNLKNNWIDVGDDLYVVLYDELYVSSCDAEKLATKMAGKVAGQEFEAFIIDSRGSRATEIGSGKTVEQQYQEAFVRHGVQSVRTQSGFIWGSDDVDGGILAIRNLLRIRPNGRPSLVVADLKNKLPNFKWEIERYRHKKVGNILTDKPEDKGRVHLMATLRYLAMYQPKFVPRAGRKMRLTGAYAIAMRKRKRDKQAGGRIVLGPSR